MKKNILQFMPIILNLIYCILISIEKYTDIGIKSVAIAWFGLISNLIVPFLLIVIKHSNLIGSFKLYIQTIVKLYIISKIGLLILMISSLPVLDGMGWAIYRFMWVFGSIIIILGSLIIRLFNRENKKRT